jgi:hypothetical protein
LRAARLGRLVEAMDLSPRSDAISSAGRAAHDIGMAALLGGNLFGRVAMHPAVEGVCTPEDRGRVVNAAWHRYGTVNSLSLAAVLVNWLAARTSETRGHLLSDRERRLALAKDVAVGAVAVTGIASAVTGVRFGKAAPGGAVPLESGSKAAAGASPEAAREKRALNLLGAASLVSELALVGIQGALAQEHFRRPPARRLLKRRY